MKSKLDDILKPVFEQWLSDEEAVISEYSTDIDNDLVEARLKNSELFEYDKRRIKALMLGLVGEDEDMEDSQVLNYKAELREAINNL